MKKQWPNAHKDVQKALVYIIKMMNDRAIDWTEATVSPKLRKPTAAEIAAAPGRRGPAGAARRVGGIPGKSSKSTAPRQQGPPPLLPDVYVDEEIRTRHVAGKFSFDNFKSELDGTAKDIEDMTYDDVKLILWPEIPPCGERTLTDICGGNPDIAKRFMALCALHLEMRVTEFLIEVAEEPLRTGLESNAGLASRVPEFNKVLREELCMRHQITARPPPASGLYPVACDGKDSRLLRESNAELDEADLKKPAARVTYKGCPFFSKLKELYGGSPTYLEKLRQVAICARHFSLAMRELRRMPRDMKRQPGGAEGVRAKFEAEARKFCTHWVAMGEQHRSYGFHLWASVADFFQKWGCMELISQCAMEGTIGKLGRIMVHIKLHAAGGYDEDTLASGPEAKRAVLAAKRARVRTYEQAVHDELCMEAQAAEYEILPCRKRTHKFQYRMKDVHMDMDRGIHEGRTMPYEEVCMYMRRFIGFLMLWCFLRGRDKLMRSRETGQRSQANGEGVMRTYGEQLLDEYHSYYSRFAVRCPEDIVDPVRDAQEQRWRKADWRAKQQARLRKEREEKARKKEEERARKEAEARARG